MYDQELYRKNRNPFFSFLKIWWCSWLTISMVGDLASDGQLWKNLGIIAQIRPTMILQNIIVIIFVVSIAIGLMLIHPIFKWSWFCLFKPKGGRKEIEGANIVAIPAQVKWFGIFFTIILLLNLPYFAKFEEGVFREGTDNWREGIVWSIYFGMLHCYVGVPIGAGMALSIGGLWFTHQYFIGGTELSTLHHTTYNLIIISLLLVGLVFRHIRYFAPKRELAIEGV
jgi:hypothetical protein